MPVPLTKEQSDAGWYVIRDGDGNITHTVEPGKAPKLVKGVSIHLKRKSKEESIFKRIGRCPCTYSKVFTAGARSLGLDPENTTIEEVFAQMLYKQAMLDAKPEAVKQVADRMWGKPADTLNVTSDIERVLLMCATAIHDGTAKPPEIEEF
jgi:hypothetical protein